MHIGKPDSSDPKKTIFERSFVLESGDLFVLGPRTNALHRHAIVPVALEKEIKRPKDYVVQPRISLVARDIARQELLKKVRKHADRCEASRAKKRAKK